VTAEVESTSVRLRALVIEGQRESRLCFVLRASRFWRTKLVVPGGKPLSFNCNRSDGSE